MTLSETTPLQIRARVARLRAARDLVFEESTVATGELGAQEIVAATEVSAISPGTELAAYTGAPPLRPGRVYPRVVGYCNVGRVLAAGADAGLQRGDRILTFQSHRSHFRIPTADVIAKLPSTLDGTTASVTYLFHLGYAALLTAGYTPGMRVAVIGLGAIGVAAVLLGQALAMDPLAVSNRAAARDGVAAHAVAVASPEEAVATKEAFFDIVVTTSNAWADWRVALQLARKGGRIAVLGFPGRGLPMPDFNPLDSRWLYDKQLSIVGAGQMSERDVPPDEIRFTVPRNMDYLLGLVRGGRLRSDALISGSYPAESIVEAYEALLDRSRAALTYVLRWS